MKRFLKLVLLLFLTLFSIAGVSDKQRTIIDNQIFLIKEGSAKNCEKGFVCVGGYVSDRITITVNYDDIQSNFISKIIFLDY